MKRFWLVNKENAWERTQPPRVVATTRSRQPIPFYNIGLTFLKALLIAAAVFIGINAYAQQSTKVQDAAYTNTLTERSKKIVNTLGITDSIKYYKVVGYLVNQYASLNEVHDQNKRDVSEIKQQSLSKDDLDKAVKEKEARKSSRLLQLHKDFIALLNVHLTNEQVDMIKDGMTYRVFPITYGAFQDMIPELTTEQKDKIYNWLKEARELAMDEGSSEDKHRVFGKYKGRINNYLSAEGYDLKKETAEWQARVKEREEKRKSTQAN